MNCFCVNRVNRCMWSSYMGTSQPLGIIRWNNNIFYSILFYWTFIALNFVRKQILRRWIAKPYIVLERPLRQKQSRHLKGNREPSQQLRGESLAEEEWFKFLTKQAERWRESNRRRKFVPYAWSRVVEGTL